MKIHAVYDKDGRILAASFDDGKYLGPRPVAGRDEQVAILDMPAAFASSSLEEICLTHRVDAKTKSLMKP